MVNQNWFGTLLAVVAASMLIGCGNDKSESNSDSDQTSKNVNSAEGTEQDPNQAQNKVTINSGSEESPKQSEISNATETLVKELKNKPKDPVPQLPVETEEEKQAKALQAMINEIVHEGVTDPEKQTSKRVGDREVWIDKTKQQVIVGGMICLRQGPLEMFACPRGTKEHESVISVNALSSQVHLCLVLCGALPGSPVKWDPEYEAAIGPKIEIDVAWKEDGELKRVSAQDMIRNFRTKEKMKTHWVFGGSEFYEEEAYYGDAGELVCLSNFSTATMDIPIESVSSDSALLFEALTENIPDVNTQVFMFFKPVIEKPADKQELQEEIGRMMKLNSLRGPDQDQSESPRVNEGKNGSVDLSPDK